MGSAMDLISRVHSMATGRGDPASGRSLNPVAIGVVIPGSVEVLWNEMSWAIGNAAAVSGTFMRVKRWIESLTDPGTGSLRVSNLPDGYPPESKETPETADISLSLELNE